MKGGPVVISFTTRNGFVILFDLVACTEVRNGTFKNNLELSIAAIIVCSLRINYLEITCPGAIFITNFPTSRTPEKVIVSNTSDVRTVCVL